MPSMLYAFLQFNDYRVLKDAGSMSHEVAKSLAEKQYEQFRIEQDKSYESDFDKLASKMPETPNSQETGK